ncbi:MAG: CehA/McbA family metallohydrolase [Isosphaeraceae bacterium]|nr:CehA/McbA family metallohydrolase [Isosphaeraceae bacterium]
MKARTGWRIRRLAAALLLAAQAQAAPPPSAGSDESGRSSLAITVTDGDSAHGIPCRVTVVDEHGSLAPLAIHPGSKLAARRGVAYTADGRVEIKLAPGRYTVYASRGFEFGVDQTTITLADGEAGTARLAIRREVPTDGLIACDTHVHTFTHSGHGDATVEERAVTLAGEGIELPIATDHDHLTDDLAAAADRMGVRAFFTPVVGDEVTTRVGHFNAFPLPTDRPAPSNQSTDWAEILRGIRSAPGERVVVLNHPRDLHGNFRPFAPEHFNPVTGEHKRGMKGVDALEVINSGAMQSDPMLPVRDWMALLNRGVRLTAVGSSDSHDVARHIVGQGRTYITGRDDDPARIDASSAARNLRAGQALVSLGLLAKITVDDRFQPGDLATGSSERVKVKVVVLGPAWTGVDRIELFANGRVIGAERFPAAMHPGEKYHFTKEIPRPPHDVSLVAVATGPGVTAPYWPIERPYQPTSPSFTPRVMAITNPVYVDGDNDGAWTSPLAYASAVIEREGIDPAKLLPALAAYDEAVAAQAASLCQAAGHDVRQGEFPGRLTKAHAAVRQGFAQFAAALAEAPSR